MTTPTIRLKPLAAASTLAFAGLVALPSAAQPDAPGWESLPEETVLCFRMPDTAAFIEQLRTQTVFGQRILTAERIDGFKQIFIEENESDWQEFTDGLEDYGFTTEDLIEISQSPWGVAMTLAPREGHAPHALGLAWADLDDEQIDRLFDAQERAMEESNEDAEYPTQRVDLELAGAQIRQLAIPETDWIESQDGEWEEVVVDRGHLLITRLPGRLILAIAPPQSGSAVQALLDDGATVEDLDWDAATDVQAVQATLARFLETMQGDADGPFAPRMLAGADAAASVPQKDHSLFEFYADAAALIDLGRQAAMQDGANTREFDQVIQGLGFDDLGLITGSYYLADQALFGRFWTEMPQPRRGLPGTLDGQTLPASPPDWVAADLSYGHFAYDLTKLYDVIVEIAVATAGPEANMQLQMANGMVMGQTQADIPTILRALGTAHRVVMLPSRPVLTEVTQWDEDAEDLVTVEKEVDTQPVAAVWDLQDGDVWQRVMTSITNFSAMAGPEANIETVEEQGFHGLRMDQQGTTMSLMLNDDHLVIGVGPDVTARVLSLLNNPPPAADRLNNADLMDQARAILGDDLKPSLFFSLQDAGIGVTDGVHAAIRSLEEGNLESDLAARLKALIPSDEDLRASFGVSVGVGTLTDSGLRLDSANALPAP